MPRSAQHPLVSLALMLGATLAFVVMQVVVKLARERGLDTTEVMFYRTAPGLPFLWWWLARRGHGLWPQAPRDVLIRSGLGALAMGSNFASMAWLSLAQFSTIGLSHPVLVALLSPWLLREKPRAHRWIAMPLALLGAVILLAPGLDARAVPSVAVLLGFASAVFSAFAQIWVRKTTASEPPERVVFHFAALVCVLALLAGRGRGYFHGAPAGTSVAHLAWLVAGMAGSGTLGQVLMTQAYARGDAASVSVVSYAGILLSIVADLAVWSVVPARSALLGAAAMLAAGVVLLRGERRLVPMTPEPAPPSVLGPGEPGSGAR